MDRHEHKIAITVVVNGQPTVVEANPEAPLHSIIPHALAQTGNGGQPPGNWELRDASGNLLDGSREIESYHFPHDVRLFLNLQAGIGGAEAVVPHQFVEPTVSRAKFERELRAYQALEGEYRRRGWLLLRADFPEVLVAMASPKLQPPAIITGVLFDYTNYDAMPPSVRLVNPFTSEPYVLKELPVALNRAISGNDVELPGMPPGARLRMQGLQPLMQAQTPEDIPFLCLAGTREYHQHPAHTGDVWELHRAAGEGRLAYLLDIIHRYGVAPINGYSVNLLPQIGFQLEQAPE